MLVKEVGICKNLEKHACAWEAQKCVVPACLFVSPCCPRMDLTVCLFQETEIDILATVQNLLRQCVQPSAFLRPLSKLFSVIHNKLPKQALTNVFQVQQST